MEAALTCASCGERELAHNLITCDVCERLVHRANTYPCGYTGIELLEGLSYSPTRPGLPAAWRVTHLVSFCCADCVLPDW